MSLPRSRRSSLAPELLEPVSLQNDAPMEGIVKCISFSAGGGSLATGTKEGTIQLWDAHDFHLMGEMQAHSGPVWDLSFSSAGSKLVSGSWDATVKLWDVSSNEILHTLKGHTAEVWSVSFGESDTVIVSGSTDETVRLWAVSSGELIDFFSQGLVHPITCVALSPDERTLVEASVDKTIRVWDLGEGTRTYEVLSRIKDEADEIARAEHNRRGSIRSLKSAKSQQRSARLAYFDVEDTGQSQDTQSKKDPMTPMGNCKVKLEMRGHTAAISCCVFHPNGGILASSSHDKTVIFWDFQTGGMLNQFRSACQMPIWSATFSIDGTVLAIGTGTGKIELWSPPVDDSESRCLHSFQAHDSYIDCCAFSRDGLRLATGGDDNRLCLWKLLPADQLLKHTEEQNTEPANEPKIEVEPVDPEPEKKDSTIPSDELAHVQMNRTLLNSLLTLRDRKKSELQRERQTVRSLQIAIVQQRRLLDELKADKGVSHRIADQRRQEDGLPSWGLDVGEHQSDNLYLQNLRRRRAVLNNKVGRSPIGSNRAYLEICELHPSDLARQALFEERLM